MAIIAAVNEETPLEIPPIQPGEYQAVISEVSVEPNANKTGQNVVVQYTILAARNGETDIPAKGRKTTEYISTKMETRLKRLAVASKVPLAGGLDTNLLLNQTLVVVITNEEYKDKKTGAQKTSTRIHDYIFE